MNAVEIFEFEDSPIRVEMVDGEPWFRANDVCKVLGYVNPWKTVTDHVDPEDLTKREVLSNGGVQQASFINESGLYALIFGSKLEAAKRFKRWVTRDVLPTLRKTGVYGMPEHEAAQVAMLDLGALGPLRARVDLVREARLNFGQAYAARAWHALGLSNLPGMTLNTEPDPRGGEALAILLAGALPDGRNIRQALQETHDPLDRRLLNCGLRVERRLGGFLVANRHPVLERVFAGSTFADARWGRALCTLPGARFFGINKWYWHGKGFSARCTFVPIHVLEGDEQARRH